MLVVVDNASFRGNEHRDSLPDRILDVDLVAHETAALGVIPQRMLGDRTHEMLHDALVSQLCRPVET